MNQYWKTFEQWMIKCLYFHFKTNGNNKTIVINKVYVSTTCFPHCLKIFYHGFSLHCWSHSFPLIHIIVFCGASRGDTLSRNWLFHECKNITNNVDQSINSYSYFVSNIFFEAKQRSTNDLNDYRANLC